MLTRLSPLLMVVVLSCSRAGGQSSTVGDGTQEAVEPSDDAVVVQAMPTSDTPPIVAQARPSGVSIPPEPGPGITSSVPGAHERGPIIVRTPAGAPPATTTPPPPPVTRAPRAPIPTPEPSGGEVPSGPLPPSDYGGSGAVDDGEADFSEAEEAMPSSVDVDRSSARSDRRARRESRRARRRTHRAGEAERSGRAAESAPMIPPAEAPMSMSADEPSIAPSAQVAQIQRILTAATVADVDRRENYLSYLNRHPGEAVQLRLDMSRRVRFRVVDGGNRPVHDAVITVVSGGMHVVGRTHADGYWDFYPSMSAPQLTGQTALYIQHQGSTSQASVPIPPVGDGRDIFIRLPQAISTVPSVLDLAFLIDVTGSMSDELRYVNEEVVGIVARVREAVPNVQVRVAATFYRDRGDAVPIEQIPFSTNIQGFVTQMRYVQASGGGDYPEDVNTGLAAALTTLQWSTGPAVRVLCLIADAPPQYYPDFPYTYHHAMIDASQRGIRLLPVAASGADRVVEFLFRALGAFTSTPYVYLTNDSGVGGHHMEADTDRVAVEMFSDLLTRLLIGDLQGYGMHEAIEDQPVLAPLQ